MKDRKLYSYGAIQVYFMCHWQTGKCKLCLTSSLPSEKELKNKIKRKRKLVANLILTPSTLYNTKQSPLGTFCIRKALDAEAGVCNVPVLQQTDKAM